MYLVAILKDNIVGTTEVIVSRNSSTEYAKERMKEYTPDQYTIRKVLITNNVEVFAKSNLKARLIDLRDSVAKHEEASKRLTGKIKEEHRELCNELEMHSMQRVSRAVQFCLDHDVEVTDELAINCYNFCFL